MNSELTIQQAQQQWLAISPADQPPHHYALLGLAPLEPNKQTILAAYQDRAEQVGRHLAGPHSAVAREMLTQLAAAQACLLNGPSKSSYDEQLKSEQQRRGNGDSASGDSDIHVTRPTPRAKDRAAAAPPGTAGAAVPMAPPPAALAGRTSSPSATDDADAEQPYAPYREPEEQPSIAPWLVGGVCAGLLAVCVLALLLFGSGPRRRTPVAEAPPPNGPGAAATAEKGDEDAARGDIETNDRTPAADERHDDVRDDMRNDDFLIGPARRPPEPEILHLGEEADDSPDALVRLDDDGFEAEDAATEASGDEDGTSASESTAVDSPAEKAAFAEVPRAVSLPGLSDPRDVEEDTAATAVLTRLSVKDPAAVQLRLASDDFVGKSNRFQLREVAAADTDAAEPRHWQVQHTDADGASNAVAEYTLDEGELTFRWLPEAAGTAATQLQNLPLAISAEGQEVRLSQRTPHQTDPLLVKVDSGAVTTSARIETPPAGSRFYMSVDEPEDAFPEHQWNPGSTIAEGQHADMIFGDQEDPFQLALRISIEESAAGVKVAARPMFRQAGEGATWSYFRPKAAAETLTQLQSQMTLLDTQMEQARRRLRRNKAGLQQATDAYNRQASALQSQIAGLQKINSLCQEMHNKAQLHFRVFSKVGEDEVDLLKTAESSQPEQPPGESSALPDDDPNGVGAPLPETRDVVEPAEEKPGEGAQLDNAG